MSHSTWHGALVEIAEKHPDAVAIYNQGSSPQTMTYKQLDVYSSIAAHRLQAAGCAKGARIPLLLSHRLDSLIWTIGIMKAGCCAVPLSTDTPAGRIQYISEDTGALFVLAHPEQASKLGTIKSLVVEPSFWETAEAAGNAHSREPEVDADVPMMIFYTSGTTGTPKGVMVNHGNVLGFADRHNAFHDIKLGTRVSCYAAISFDAILIDAYAPLLAGAQLFLVSEKERKSIVALHRFYRSNRIEFAFLTTKLGELYISTFDNPQLKRLCTGGEVLRTFVPRQYEVMNLYGPTETTAYVTASKVTKTLDDYPLGFPLPGIKIILLDHNGNPCPPGCRGEICISGDQVSAGYLNKPEETKKVFTHNPLYCPTKDGRMFNRLYRTGDIGIMGTDGQLYYRGRTDLQVKIRGCRIEPEEVEATFLEFPDIDHAYVKGCRDENGDVFLAAYFSRKRKDSNGTSFMRELKEFLHTSLPAQMVPACIMELSAFPLSPNGKVDFLQLPMPTRSEPY